MIGDTGVRAHERDDTRVREWLVSDPTRTRYFEMIGVLSEMACEPLATGNWPELGKLMNINQLVLERIGVSCPELERLMDAVIDRGCIGRKAQWQWWWRYHIALVTDEVREAVMTALKHAGARAVYAPELAVAGVHIETP